MLERSAGWLSRYTLHGVHSADMAPPAHSPHCPRCLARRSSTGHTLLNGGQIKFSKLIFVFYLTGVFRQIAKNNKKWTQHQWVEMASESLRVSRLGSSFGPNVLDQNFWCSLLFFSDFRAECFESELSGPTRSAGRMLSHNRRQSPIWSSTSEMLRRPLATCNRKASVYCRTPAHCRSHCVCVEQIYPRTSCSGIKAICRVNLATWNYPVEQPEPLNTSLIKVRQRFKQNFSWWSTRFELFTKDPHRDSIKSSTSSKHSLQFAKITIDHLNC